MKKITGIPLFMCLLLFGCRHSNRVVLDDGIVFLDANQDGARMDLAITDIADVFLIPLKFGAENVILGSVSPARTLFVHQDKIYIGDWRANSPKLVVYDFNGEPLQVFGSYGNGPGEYIGLNAFIVDTVANEVILYERLRKKFTVFDLSGKFKREKIFSGSEYGFDAIEDINESFMLAYKDGSRMISDKDAYENGRRYIESGLLYSRGKPFTLFDKQTLSEVDFLDFEYAEPAQWDVFLLLHYLSTTKDGVYITTSRSDTVYFIDRDLELMPKFVEVSKYQGLNQAKLMPVVETDRYVYFGMMMQTRVEKNDRVNIENSNVRKFFVYDKGEQKLFRLNTGLPEISSTSATDALVNNRVAFDEYCLTLNHNYVATFLFPEYISKHYHNLPPNIKEAAKDMAIDDNPMLMLMKLK